jgi:hypothetical protein
MYKTNKIAHSKSLLNIQREPDFLENTFKPCITALHYKTDRNYNYDDDDYIEFDFEPINRSLPLKKYKTILYNFAELLRIYNNAVSIRAYKNQYLVSARISYKIQLYYSQYSPDDYIIVMQYISVFGSDFKYFPGDKGIFMKNYCYIYDRHLIDLILNCYTYSHFTVAAKNSTILLDDIMRIVYEYTIGCAKN